MLQNSKCMEIQYLPSYSYYRFGGRFYIVHFCFVKITKLDFLLRGFSCGHVVQDLYQEISNSNLCASHTASGGVLPGPAGPGGLEAAVLSAPVVSRVPELGADCERPGAPRRQAVAPSRNREAEATQGQSEGVNSAE